MSHQNQDKGKQRVISVFCGLSHILLQGAISFIQKLRGRYEQVLGP